MGMILTIAWRNLWRHTRRTILTMATISLGLALFLVSVGLNDGGHMQMIESVVRLGSGHVLIQRQGYLASGGVERYLTGEERRRATEWIRSQSGSFSIQRVAGRVFASGLASSADGASGVLVIGMDPGVEREISLFHEKLLEGEFPEDLDSGQAILGRGVARRLVVGIGDRVVLTAQAAKTGELESMLVRVGGIVHTGIEELDEMLALLPIGTAQRFLGMGDGVHHLAILLAEPTESEPLANLGKREMSDLEVVHWSEAHPEIVDFIELDTAGGYLFLLMIFILIGFLVLNTLLMSVLERGREFALLDALGLTPVRRFAMVMAEALVVAALATVGGAAIGFGAHLYFAVYGLPMDLFFAEEITVAGVAFDPIIYSHLSAGRMLESVLLVFGLTLVLALVAARRAARPGEIGILGRS